MAIVIDFLGYDSIEIAAEAPEDTPKQNGARCVAKVTVSGAAGGVIPAARLGMTAISGVIPGIVAAAITTFDANGVTIPNTNGAYSFEVFGTRVGARENYDPALLL